MPIKDAYINIKYISYGALERKKWKHYGVSCQQVTFSTLRGFTLILIGVILFKAAF
jgi:hypothetical protein